MGDEGINVSRLLMSFFMLNIWDFILKVNEKLLKYLIHWNAMIRNANELVTLKWLILCYANFTSIKKLHL